MRNRILLISCAVFLLIGLLGLGINFLSPSIGVGELLYLLGISISQILALILLITNGKIIKTAYFKVILLFISILFIGALFKVLHWPYSSIILIISSIGISITYALWFFSKKEKNSLDILKLLWVFASYVGGSLNLLHYLTDDYRIVSQLLLLMMIIKFTIIEFKNKRL